MLKYLRLFCFVVLSFSCSFLSAQTPGSDNILYVKKGAGGNGSSWNSPLGELADALKYANGKSYSTSNPLKIYVAKGLYSPKYNAKDMSTNDKEDYAFSMVKNVHIYGGFDPDSGMKTLDNRRDYVSTVLHSETLHIFHILVAIGKEQTGIILDGFTISTGNANGSGTLTINGESVSRSHGGALNIDRAKMTIKNCYFSENYAFDRGGAIYATGDGVGNTDLTLINTILYRNISGSHGSAVSVNGDAKVSVVNCTVYQNSSRANDYGGAIDCNGGGSQDINIYNTIIYDNTRNNSILVNISGGSASKYKNIRSIIYNGVWNSDYNTNATNYVNADPKIDIVSSYPYINSFRLTAGSPAINNGNNSYYKGLTSDKDAYQSERFMNNSIDIGASEYWDIKPSNYNVLYVKKGSVGNGSSWSNAIGELSVALQWANDNKTKWGTDKPLEIWVARGTYKPRFCTRKWNEFDGGNCGRDMSFFMVDHVNLYGGFDGTEDSKSGRKFIKNDNNKWNTILSGDFNGGSSTDLTDAEAVQNPDGAYHVIIAASNENITTIIDGFTIKGGNAKDNLKSRYNGVDINHNFGGGIYSISSKTSNITLTNSSINNNFSSNGGGGIYSIGEVGDSSIKLFTTSVDHNTSSNGGGIYSSADKGTSHIILTNSGLVSNRTKKKDDISSGIFTTAQSNDIKLLNSTIADNKGGNYFIYFNNGTKDFSVNNSIVFGNSETMQQTNFNQYYSVVQGENTTENGNLPASSIDINKLFNNISSGDYRLGINSPVIDKGNNDIYTQEIGNPFTDKDLGLKSRVYGEVIDMGAYESLYNTNNLTNNLIYVNANVSGGKGDGSSWDDAIKDLGDALKLAYETRYLWSKDKVLQIWVANGVYKPKYKTVYDAYGVNWTASNNNRNNTFLMVENVHLYGGFAGTETAVSQRTNLPNATSGGLTILSGDFNGDDVIGTISTAGASAITKNTENAYHVVVSAHKDEANARMDGFVISGGNANGSGSNRINGTTVLDDRGGGIYANTSGKTAFDLYNSQVVNNSSKTYGGGIFTYGETTEADVQSVIRSDSNILLFNSNITNNTSLIEGGGIYARASSFSSIRLDHSSIINNTSRDKGAAICSPNNLKNSHKTSIIINNSNISGNLLTNIGDGRGSALYLDGLLLDDLHIYKSTMTNNIGTSYIYNNHYGVYFKSFNNILYGNYTTLNSKINSNFYTYVNGQFNPEIENSLLQNESRTDKGNINGTLEYQLFSNVANGDYSLLPISIVIDAGNKNVQSPASVLSNKDILGNPRITGANIDMGAYEYQCFTPAPTGNAEQNFNQNDTLAALVVNGQNIKWYATQADAQAHVNALASNTVIVFNTTYYATQTIGQCESTASLAVLAYNQTLGSFDSNNLNSKRRILLYPNPVVDILHIKTDEKIERISIYGMDNKRIRSTDKLNANKQLDVRYLPQGVYIIQIVTPGAVENLRFIKI